MPPRLKKRAFSRRRPSLRACSRAASCTQSWVVVSGDLFDVRLIPREEVTYGREVLSDVNIWSERNR